MKAKSKRDREEAREEGKVPYYAHSYDPCGTAHPGDLRFEPDPEEEEAREKLTLATDIEDPRSWTRALDPLLNPRGTGASVDSRLLATARRLPPPSPLALVFAYGSNLLAEQMRSRVPGSAPLGAAVLRHHRLDFVGWSDAWKGGVATVSPQDASRGGAEEVPPPEDKVSQVHGLVWRVPVGGLDRLDRFEGHGVVYNRTRHVVEIAGGSVLAWCYQHRRPDLAPPSKAYVRTILDGAAGFNLPEAHKAHVKAAAHRARKWAGQRVLG